MNPVKKIQKQVSQSLGISSSSLPIYPAPAPSSPLLILQ